MTSGDLWALGLFQMAAGATVTFNEIISEAGNAGR